MKLGDGTFYLQDEGGALHELPLVDGIVGPDLDDPAEERAYLAHVEAEHADHDCDEVHGEEFEPHDCTEEEVEETTTYPTRSGRITVTGRCVVCGATRYSYPDSIL